MLIIRLVMVHMGPKHTQYGQKTARLAPVLQNGLKGHVGALKTQTPFGVVFSMTHWMGMGT